MPRRRVSSDSIAPAWRMVLIGVATIKGLEGEVRKYEEAQEQK